MVVRVGGEFDVGFFCHIPSASCLRHYPAPVQTVQLMCYISLLRDRCGIEVHKARVLYSLEAHA